LKILRPRLTEHGIESGITAGNLEIRHG
jgi:hypothetical protein